MGKVRIEASRVLLNLEYHCKGLDAALSMFVKFLEEEPSSRGEVKLAVHAMQLCQMNVESELGSNIACPTLVALLRLLTSKKAFNNAFLRHYLFCISQIIARRPPTLYGVPRVQVHSARTSETCSEQQNKPVSSTVRMSRQLELAVDTEPNLSSNVLPIVEAAKEADTVSNCSERRTHVLKIKVRQPASSSKADDVDRVEHSRGGHNEAKSSPCNSVSVDAPIRGAHEPFSTSNQIIEEVNSSHDQGSRLTISISSTKHVNKDEFGKDLQCTADSRKDSIFDQFSPTININNRDEIAQKTSGMQSLPIVVHDEDELTLATDDQEAKGRGKKDKKKDKEKKRKREDKTNKDHHDDPEYLERKRRKKNKKRMEKELAKKQKEAMTSSEFQNSARSVGSNGNSPLDELKKLEERVEHKVSKSAEVTSDAPQSSAAPRLRIKIKSQGAGIS